MNDAFISVGSNINASVNIPIALHRLQEFVNVCETSTFYQTEDVHCSNRPQFSNGVWHVFAECGPLELKHDILRNVEANLGRVRTADRYAPRTIDLDLVLYGNMVVHTTDLTLPDPEIRNRSFIAVPLLELAPDLTLPDTGEHLANLPSARDRSMRILKELTEALRKIISGRP